MQIVLFSYEMDLHSKKITQKPVLLLQWKRFQEETENHYLVIDACSLFVCEKEAPIVSRCPNTSIKYDFTRIESEPIREREENQSFTVHATMHLACVRPIGM